MATSSTGEVLLCRDDDTIVATVDHPVACDVLDGPVYRGGYDQFGVQDGSRLWAGRAQLAVDGGVITIVDDWEAHDTSVTVHRQISAKPDDPIAGGPHPAFRLQLIWGMRAGSPRILVPGLVYSPSQWSAESWHSYSDHRLAHPTVAAYRADVSDVVVLDRITTAAFDAIPDRVAGQSAYVHRTDIGAMGFLVSADEVRLGAAWPYDERETSAMLDGHGTPAVAYFPLDGEVSTTMTYRLSFASAADFAMATRSAFDGAVEAARPTPTPPPVTLARSIDLRLGSASTAYKEWDDGFAGFLLNFDPETGYDSEAKAFGASNTEHQMSGSRDVLEYGFTGRQLNLAYLLAQRDPDEWAARGAKVVDAFVDRMCTPSGWVHTLWHTGRGRPLYACGDSTGAVMHYLGQSDVPGTYTRMMAEAGWDLLLNHSLHRSLGQERPAWLSACLRLADFFVRYQDDDGAWYRAYSPAGRPLTGGEWFGSTPAAGKTATSSVIPFLLAVYAASPSETQYRDAAIRAGEYVRRHQVALDDFRGGTLDNPNLVDKEAAFLAMRAALAIHRETGDGTWLDTARRAATQAITWHSIWEVPNVAGTPVSEAGVRSVGWGGINSVWGTGVTDIYSLFFAGDLVRLTQFDGDPVFAQIAELIAHASLQLLAVPGQLHGFADTGMQPEGIAFCDQGVDDGVIRKGDTWGGLAWPYTAGTYGLADYLDAIASADLERPATPANS